MTTASLVQLHPALPTHRGAIGLSDDELLALYQYPATDAPFVRANFISSVDGSASASGLSEGLGEPADKRVFDLLRQLSHVVVVGAGTIRAEGYGALRLGEEATAWREANGLSAQPPVAIVSGRLDLDPTSDIFTAAPVRPLVLTSDAADAGRRDALSNVADVISCGGSTVEAVHLVAALAARGLTQIHCEGGPSLLGDLIAADVLDALCLTTSPNLEGGIGPRITHAAGEIPLRPMTLDHLLLSGSMLLAHYSRTRK